MITTGLRRIAGGLLLALVAVALASPRAVGDGDPASDVLLGTNVFYPYSPAVAPGLQAALNAETAAAARAHFPLKIALIDSPIDLGVIPELFDKPAQYAKFLDQEISFQSRQLLLVVMPNGFGAQGLDGAATDAVATLKKPAGTKSNDLARAALAAVPALAAAAGHRISGHAAASSGGHSGGGTSPVVPVVILAVLAVAAAGAVLTLRQRRTRTS